MTTVGLLYPGHFAEDDFPRMEILLDAVRLVVNRTDIDEDAYVIDALIRTGSPEHLAAGVEELQRAGVECVVWASGGGSFLYGWEGAHEQAAALARATGVPASSTSLGFAHAVRELGADRVAVASTYPERITGLFADFLHAAGIDVAVTHAASLGSAAEAAAWDLDRVKELAVAADRPEADAVLLPDTALHTAGHEADLEELLGKPVLTGNQVTVREGLRLARRRSWSPRLGKLFAEREAPPAPVVAWGEGRERAHGGKRGWAAGE
ncbi:aspartate/glutamate racemase family protein [Streptomyces sp. NBC_01591]|uniref:maleate cis-trans isomerase family protein n=1 Tax=Streptomyces sp. NBC_01591 TaxID=2975888 RepID=UPI002DDABF04|nr:decarboxylase [Streptomyces sp. NBC_01591]WSD68622.1 aspartate/glutamate racemase family protein [Streptomyces sp. NBC_01591]